VLNQSVTSKFPTEDRPLKPEKRSPATRLGTVDGAGSHKGRGALKHGDRCRHRERLAKRFPSAESLSVYDGASSLGSFWPARAPCPPTPWTPSSGCSEATQAGRGPSRLSLPHVS
jgi:hypothetical protein